MAIPDIKEEIEQFRSTVNTSYEFYIGEIKLASSKNLNILIMRTCTVLAAILLVVFFGGCGQTDSERITSTEMEISNIEKSILDSIEFDYTILESIRSYSDSTIQLKSTSSDYYNDSTKSFETEVKVHSGITFNAERSLAPEIVSSLKDQFRKNGYLIYVSAVNFGYSPDQVTVIKSKDQFDILRIEETAAYNYDLENSDVLEKFLQWDKLNHFEIIGASSDWVEANFIQKPTNIKKFAQELYEFCPDVVDQGAGSIKELEKEMNAFNILYLCWD